MYKQVSRAVHLLILLLIVVLLGTCASSIYLTGEEDSASLSAGSVSMPLINMASPVPAVPATMAPELPAVEAGAVVAQNTSGDWSLARPGLEQRVMSIYDNANQLVETLHIWRLDQNYFRMEVAFDGSPKSLEAWQNDTNALMVINGGFYSIENERYFPDGLTILNGADYGNSLNRFEGMLAIRESGAEVRWLDRNPYDPAEPLRAALQSFPILVRPGGTLGYGPERESNASARRTVIAQDRKGRILFMVAPKGYFTLHELSVYLAGSDLDLDIALNLDGGGSTGLLVADPFEVIPTNRPIPFVILVYPR